MKNPYLILFALLAFYVVVGSIDYDTERRAEQERVEAHCAVLGKLAAQDRDGHWTCTDSAPAWAMASPIDHQGEQQ